MRCHFWRCRCSSTTVHNGNPSSTLSPLSLTCCCCLSFVVHIYTHTHTYIHICLTREGGAQFPWHFCLNILLGILFLVVIYVIINICALSLPLSFFLSVSSFIVVAVASLLLLLLLSFCCCFHLNNNFIANAFNAHLSGARDECYLRRKRERERGGSRKWQQQEQNSWR